MFKFILFVVFGSLIYWFWTHGLSAGISRAPAASPLADSASIEQDYYTKVFDYTMDAIPAGQNYIWKSYSAEGSISVGEAYVSKSKHTCRKFEETITTADGIEKNASGIACKRQGADGWCRLKPTDAQTCAMEQPSGLLGGIQLGTGDAIEQGKGLLGKVNGWVR